MAATTEQITRKRIILIDGFGIIFRAYHAVPPTLKTPKGELTNAVFGFTSMVLEVLQRDTPDYIVMAFDIGRTFRHDEYTEYKANRSEMPEDLRNQIGRIREVVEALGIKIQEMEGFEADDVIGTLARQAESENLDPLIITGDNDLLQLVNDRTQAVLPGGGFKGRFQDARYYDVEKVIEKYGFEPKFIPDYKALCGDKSDNIPGVPGIGDKTATTLIKNYGHLEEILAHLDEITPAKTQEALRKNSEQSLQSKRLATIVTAVPLKVNLEECRAHQMDRVKVVELFRELEFRSLLSKLPMPPSATPTTTAPSKSNGSDSVKPKKAAPTLQMSMFGEEEQSQPENATPVNETKPEVANSNAPTPKVSSGTYTTVGDSDQLRKLVARILKSGRFAFDTETTSQSAITAKLVGVSLAPTPKEAYYIPVGHVRTVEGGTGAVTEPQAGQLGWEEVRKALAPLFADPKLQIAAHHAKYDMEVLHQHGINIQNIALKYDTKIASQLLGDNASELKNLAFTRLGEEMTHIEALIGSGKKQTTMDKVEIETATQYASADADMTLRLVDLLTPELERDGLKWLFEEVEIPLVPVLTAMELCGVAINTEALGELSRKLYTEITALETKIYAIVGHEFNINSPDQLGKVLFEELGLPASKKTATKKFSTDKKTLEGLSENHEIVQLVLECRHLGKLKSTYVDSLPLLVNAETGRVHTSFNQLGASSGRISSSDPNLQNIPIRTDIGREVRRAFVADNTSAHRLFDEPTYLFSADYSQIELRLLAHLTHDPTLNDAFNHNKDPHRTTAATVFGVTENEVTDDMRRVAKTVNFGIIYGLSAHGLSRQLGISYKESSDFIKAYNEKYPNVRAYLERTPDEGREKGFVETLLHRRRAMPELKSTVAVVKQEAERQAINMPIQGTAADIVKIAMIRIYQEMQTKKMRAKLLLQVHDELVFEAPQSELAELAALVKQHMEATGEVIELKVPLKVDLKVGQNWGEMESYKL
jgi:DNA polymerase-1